MTQDLDLVCRELGLTQYFDAFVGQGFDTWEVLLDIQESDLDALGVKLGHRRKLQRRIANARSAAHSSFLASSVKAAIEDGKPNGARRGCSRAEGSVVNASVTKRKYRRHPKPDEHAPERPPTAYVIFSNKIREDLKGQKLTLTLTFAEIAKLVGESWQSSEPTKKQAYESQATAARQKYHRDLAEYKKTPEYARYRNYLQDFKKRQARHSQARDSVKRPKLQQLGLRHKGPKSSDTMLSGAHGGGSRSGSEMVQVSKVSINCQLICDTSSPEQLDHRSCRRSSTWQGKTRCGESSHEILPSLWDILDDGTRGIAPLACLTEGIPDAPDSVSLPDSTSDISPGRSRLVLREEMSAYGSTESTSSTASLGGMHGVRSLPPHAFLSLGATDRQVRPLVAITASLVDQQNIDSENLSHRPRIHGLNTQSPAVHNIRHIRVEHSGEGNVFVMLGGPIPANDANSAMDGFDGFCSLLRAGEIIGRHDRD